MTTSAALGETAVAVEVTNVSKHGLWLLAADRELFLPYKQFPRFKDASLSAVLNVEEPTPGHYHWPDLDVDLGLETIEHSERFPLTYTGSASSGSGPMAPRPAATRGQSPTSMCC